MSQHCIICGIELEENAPVCPKCGMQNPTEIPDLQVLSTPTVPPKKKRKALPFILGGAAVAIVAAVLILLHVFGNAPSEPAKQPSILSSLWENSLTLINGNFDDLEAMAPDIYWEWFAEQRHTTKENLLEKMKDDQILNYKLTNPKGDIIYTGKILSEVDIDDQLLEKIAEVLFSSYEIPQSSVTAGKKVTIQRSKLSSDSAKDLPEQTLFAVKIDDSWYFITYREFDGGAEAYFFFY